MFLFCCFMFSAFSLFFTTLVSYRVFVGLDAHGWLGPLSSLAVLDITNVCKKSGAKGKKDLEKFNKICMHVLKLTEKTFFFKIFF